MYVEYLALVIYCLQALTEKQSLTKRPQLKQLCIILAAQRGDEAGILRLLQRGECVNARGGDMLETSLVCIQGCRLHLSNVVVASPHTLHLTCSKNQFRMWIREIGLHSVLVKTRTEHA